MYKDILIAIDGSDLAGKTLVQGLSLAKALASQVTVVTVTEPWSTQVTEEAAIAYPFQEYEKAVSANAAEILSLVLGNPPRFSGETSQPKRDRQVLHPRGKLQQGVRHQPRRSA